jgi:DNA-nicking Smr family endonuclease
MLHWSDGVPEHTYDLHGQRVEEAARNVEQFLLGQARAGRKLVRVITGRGRSGGSAPIRTRVRTLLRRLKDEGRIVRDYVLDEGEGSFLVKLRR